MALLSERDKKNATQALVIMAILLPCLVFVLVVADWDGKPAPKADWRTEDHRYLAYTVAEKAVTKVLTSPGSAQFPGMFEKMDHVRQSGQKYRVNSWVDSQNTFGALLRTEFVAEVEQVAEDSWQLNSLSVNGEKLVER